MTPQAFLARFTAFGPLVVVLAVILAVFTLAAIRACRQAERGAKLLWPMLFVDSLLAVVLFTLLPASGGGTAVNWELGWGLNLIEFAANAALYIPAGFCLARVLGRRHLVQGLVVLALGLPVAVEVLQNVLALGRISDVNDVLANGLGACLGLALSLVVSNVVRARRLAPVRSSARQPARPAA